MSKFSSVMAEEWGPDRIQIVTHMQANRVNESLIKISADAEQNVREAENEFFDGSQYPNEGDNKY